MKTKLLFVLIFAIIGFIALQIPVNVLAGAKVKFTLFDLFAPISGAFLGSGIGIVAVLAVQTTNLLLHGFSGVQTDSILKLVATLRFLPLVFGVLYFASLKQKFSRLILIVPIASIIAFNLHPIGRSVWYYSLFWLIPLIIWPVRGRFLIARSFGSTFSAHAVGGAVWIWAFNLPASVWISLIPVVVLERAIFALGISASFILMNNMFAYLDSKNRLFKFIPFDKNYVFKTLKPKP